MSPVGEPSLSDQRPGAGALGIQVNRNLFVQAVGLAMVALSGLSVITWPWLLGWTLLQGAVLAAEDQLLRRASVGSVELAAKIGPPLLRIAATALYALAAFAMIVRGGPSERLFAFALMSVSMVHVLMRYYRSRLILVASLSPYVAILALTARNQIRDALAHHQVGAMLAASFTVVLFGVQFWYARAQLAATWSELMRAREAAEERERAAESANRAKSNFLATMSHEFRTPLNGVLGMVQALTADRLTSAQQERVKIIRRSSESLLAVLNDLLDLSKIEANALELEITRFDLEHLVRGVAAAYQPLAQKKGLSFSFQVDPAARGAYLGDSARIRRILYSLADNAVKFTDAGGVTLTVLREAGDILFRIDDTGPGIAEENLDHLFDGFFQADSSLNRRHGGAGLGLAICREIATLMGGSVEAASELHAGSTFVVRLPLVRAEPAAAQPKPADAAGIEPEAPEIRVLAAEDNHTNQIVLKTLLAQAGIEPTIVENGREALEAWESQTWDIILMDIQMPVMDGVVATRAIRERERTIGRPRTPIIAVTANAMTHQVAEYESAGMDGLVPKPIDLAALFSAMQQALEPPPVEASRASAA